MKLFFLTVVALLAISLAMAHAITVSKDISITITPSGTRINATDYCAANGGGNGTSGSPWRYNCIQAAVNAANPGDDVYLAGGNWQLDTADATYVSINKSINLVGAGSGNTFDAYGHINNINGTTLCPTAGTSITCIKETGTSYSYGTAPRDSGHIRFGADGVGPGTQSNCANVTISHIFFDGSTTTDGGNYRGLLAIQNCIGPVTISDIRFLTFYDTLGSGGTETQFLVAGTHNVLVSDSLMGNPTGPGSSYTSGQALESVLNSGMTVSNNAFWQGVYNPTDDDSVVFTGNTTIASQAAFDPAYGVSGCGLDPGHIGGHECAANAGYTGTFHGTFSNNYNYGGAKGMSIGSGVNDPNTNGNVSDLAFTGNWVVGATASIDSCVWRIFNDQGNCGGGGMSINAQADANCVLSSNGNPFTIINNSIISTAAAELNGQATSTMKCYDAVNPTGIDVTLKIFGFNAQGNYLSSPSNQFNTNANNVSPVVSNNYCAVGGAGTVPACATSGFTTPPTCSFTAGTLSVSKVPFTNTTFTAQYGAVQWLASISSTTPLSNDSRWSSNNSSFPDSSANSYVPPVSLSPVAHGNTVYMWVMDNANHIASCGSSLVP